MNTIILISVFSILIISALLILFIRARIEITNFKKKYSRIIDVEAERNIIVEEIKKISEERDRIKSEFVYKKDKLSTEYDNAHGVYEKLQKEISLLEESLEMTEFGIYKPHFDFGSSDEYRRQLEVLNESEKEMVRSNNAIVCDTEWAVSGS
jgi:hypothetical protein